jgi:hypothetical protein
VATLEIILKNINKATITGDDVLCIVEHLRKRGLIDISAVKSGRGSTLYIPFLENFWNYGKSPYVKDKLAHDQALENGIATSASDA